MKINNRIKLFIVLLLGVSTITCKQAENNAGIKFSHIEYRAALEKAGDENKLVFLDAYASWCGPCKYMSAKIFTDDKVGEYFNENFVNLKIDMEKGEGPALSRKLGVRAYPTLYIIDKNGKIVAQNVGALNKEKLMKFGEGAISSKG